MHPPNLKMVLNMRHLIVKRFYRSHKLEVSCILISIGQRIVSIVIKFLLRYHTVRQLKLKSKNVKNKNKIKNLKFLLSPKMLMRTVYNNNGDNTMNLL